MTEGDITRLNRMYKCPNFKEETYEEIFGENNQVEDEITPENSTTVAANESVTVPNIISNDKPTRKLVNELKKLTKNLIQMTQPLCMLQQKIKKLLLQIESL